MKKLSTIIIALSSLGACMLSPMTPPPPALDMSTPENQVLVTDIKNLVDGMEIANSNGNGTVTVTVADDGTLSIPSSAIPSGFEEFIDSDSSGNLVLNLHTIIDKGNGVKHIVYKMGDSYIAAVLTDVSGVQKLVVKNTPTIDYGTIDWDSDGGIFEMAG